MKRCVQCSQLSPDDAMRCQSCGGGGFIFPRPPKVTGNIGFRSAGRRMVILTIIVVLISGVSLLGNYCFCQSKLARLARQFADELTQTQQQHEAAVQSEEEVYRSQASTQESAHRVLLGNAAIISGALAVNRHQQEWARRLSHDLLLASSPIETNLVQMERLGSDRAIAAQTALEKVAKLAAPPRSRVEVSKRGDGFEVRVAFRMSALTPNESGAITKHHDVESMRREVEQLSGRV